MSDTAQKIKEIREALEKATPGSWKIDEFGAVTDRKGNLIQWYDGKVVTAQKEDAHLIANAPEWLRFLLSELDKRDKLIDVLKGLVQEFYQVSHDLYRNKWKKEGDMFAQGQSDAFDTAAQRLEATLKECGVTVE